MRQALTQRQLSLLLASMSHKKIKSLPWLMGFLVSVGLGRVGGVTSVRVGANSRSCMVVISFKLRVDS